MTHRTLLMLALLTTGCGRYDIDPNHYIEAGVLWDPLSALPTDAGLFVRLPQAGDVALLSPGKDTVRVHLDDAEVSSIEAGVGDAVLARSTEFFCDEGASDSKFAYDCPSDRLTQVGRADLIDADGSVARFDVGSWYGAFTFSDDGHFAVAPIDANASTAGGGLVNLTSVLVIDAEAKTSYEVSVGFAADRVIFRNDADGKAIGMLVLSRSEVADVDLTSQVAVPRATYPLTLDVGQTVTPLDVALTPDNHYALITIEGSGDLYVLDLESPSINIVALLGHPAALLVDPVSDRTYITYKSSSRIDVLDHVRFDVETLDVDSATDHLVQGPGFVFAYSLSGALDGYRVDTTTFAVDRYRFTQPPTRLELAPDGGAAIALTATGGIGRLEVADLRQVDGKVDAEVKPFGLDGLGVGLTFASDADGSRALILQDGVDTLYSLSWPSLQVKAVDLPSAPAAIGTMPNGAFYITHHDALGLVSFLDGADNLTEVHGFGQLGILDRPLLTQEEN
jgi:DNA-binding beta-propeller fold protein YncE